MSIKTFDLSSNLDLATLIHQHLDLPETQQVIIEARLPDGDTVDIFVTNGLCDYDRDYQILQEHTVHIHQLLY